MNKSWRQHPTKQYLYGHLPPITKTIQVRQTRHVGRCWRSRDELVNDILMWTPSHGRAKAGRPARTYIQQLCTDTGYSLKDLPGAMDGRDGWWEKVREIHAGGVTWWWRHDDKTLQVKQVMMIRRISIGGVYNSPLSLLLSISLTLSLSLFLYLFLSRSLALPLPLYIYIYIYVCILSKLFSSLLIKHSFKES